MGTPDAYEYINSNRKYINGDYKCRSLSSRLAFLPIESNAHYCELKREDQWYQHANEGRQIYFVNSDRMQGWRPDGPALNRKTP
jgi:hypothetical protein